MLWTKRWIFLYFLNNRHFPFSPVGKLSLSRMLALIVCRRSSRIKLYLIASQFFPSLFVVFSVHSLYVRWVSPSHLLNINITTKGFLSFEWNFWKFLNLWNLLLVNFFFNFNFLKSPWNLPNIKHRLEKSCEREKPQKYVS